MMLQEVISIKCRTSMPRLIRLQLFETQRHAALLATDIKDQNTQSLLDHWLHGLLLM
jgi:hypothetical protein